jgi:hypothetical protein
MNIEKKFEIRLLFYFQSIMNIRVIEKISMEILHLKLKKTESFNHFFNLGYIMIFYFNIKAKDVLS